MDATLKRTIVTVISGSPRKNGNTEILLREILGTMGSESVDVHYYHLNNLNFRGCQGCMYCRSHPFCTMKDDLSAVLSSIQESDLVMIGSPVYMYQVTGQTKLFFDRMLAFLNRDFSTRLVQPKRLILVFSQAQKEPSLFEPCFEQTEKLMKMLGFTVISRLNACGVNHPGDVKRFPELLEKARQTGEMIKGSMIA